MDNFTFNHLYDFCYAQTRNSNECMSLFDKLHRFIHDSDDPTLLSRLSYWDMLDMIEHNNSLGITH